MNQFLSGIIGVILCLLPICLSAQLSEDFTDRDITNNPTWIGDDSLFSVTANEELQSQGNPLTETIYLATAQNQLNDIEWRIDLRYAFGPSGSNAIRIYLMADQSNMRAALQGYFLQIGESGSNDSYDLYRQDGTTITKIIDGVDGRAGSGVDVRIRVSRTLAGVWELYSDPSKTDNFQLEGSATDNTYNSTAWFGISVTHTSSRANSFFFDNIYVGPEVQDTMAPDLLSVNVLSATSLELHFSEAMESSSAGSAANYRLQPDDVAPANAQLDPTNAAKVILTLANPLVSGNSYSIEVSGLSDLAGNLMQGTQSQTFDYLEIESALAFDVVINEIFADPTPSQGLPEAEFLELFNRSNKVLDLQNWSISNGSTVGLLPAHVMGPGELLILTRDTDAGRYSPLGTTISPTNWTTLVNSGDNLGLRSADGVLIDTVDYEPEWFRDEFKAGGGFSLERINPDNLDCPSKANWASTVNAQGGTPGAFNSIFNPNPENDPPALASVAVLDPQNLELCFDEPMDAASLNNLGIYTLTGIGAPLSAEAQGPDFECVRLSFSTALQLGQIYQLEVDAAVVDCSGNAMGSMSSLPVVLARPAQAHEVVFTELFPDFSPSEGLPDAEFVEIYNRTAEVLDLSGSVLTDGGGFALINNLQIFPNEYVILCKLDDAEEFESFGKTVGLDGFPSLGNATDSLTFFAVSGDVLDFVYYSDDWYGDPDKASGGFSLEKIDPNYLDCNQPDNWRASEALDGGTPGSENSINGSYTDTELPLISGIRILGSNGLELIFSEQMDPASLEMLSNYVAGQGIGTPILAMATAPHYTSVRLSFDQDFQENILYTLDVAGLLDCASNELEGSFSFGLPLPAQIGDVLINEILFNPRSGGADYVEIANVSEKILDLKSLRIGEIFPETDSIFNSDPLTTTSVLFFPGQLICLTADAGFQIQQYQPIAAANFLEMESFPSYDDGSGECVIFSDSGAVLDRFYYEDDFHYPTLIDDDGVSLERISLSVPASEASNWHSAASTLRFGTPGYPNSQEIDQNSMISEVRLDRESFTPDLDGVGDVVAIEYDFDFNGANARVSVLDSQGRPIKILQQNTLLGTEAGSFFWDGTDAKGTKADLGIYIILFELTQAENGQRQVYKLPVVLAAKF
ncbi:MAG: lamin tail domain-containing protein [Bacteroidia bacterium]|nr:lamin tail domain-containing protein [Bacteroidia bacterium]